MLAGAGDELQGIKRGIMEMADSVIITKADGTNIQKAKNARTEYAHALHLFPPTESGWIPKVAAMTPRMVWGRKNFATDRCPKSIVNGPSVSYLEMHHAWLMAGRGDASGYPAKAADAFATLERLYREEQENAGFKS